MKGYRNIFFLNKENLHFGLQNLLQRVALQSYADLFLMNQNDDYMSIMGMYINPW